MKAQNYTDSQIEVIKNFDSSEEMITRFSATVSATLNINSFYYDTSKKWTYASIAYSGQWNGTPIVKGSDETGVAIIGTVLFSKNGYSIVITYADGAQIKILLVNMRQWWE